MGYPQTYRVPIKHKPGDHIHTKEKNKTADHDFALFGSPLSSATPPQPYLCTHIANKATEPFFFQKKAGHDIFQSCRLSLNKLHYLIGHIPFQYIQGKKEAHFKLEGTKTRYQTVKKKTRWQHCPFTVTWNLAAILRRSELCTSHSTFLALKQKR